MSRTLAIIKPDAVAGMHVRAICNRIHAEGFRTVDTVTRLLTGAEVEALYAEHKDRPFFADLCTFMTSGPVVIIVIESGAAHNAVRRWRAVMGSTDSRKAKPNTIRGLYGDKVGPMYRNAVHGSDSDESAEREIALFFGIPGYNRAGHVPGSHLDAGGVSMQDQHGAGCPGCLFDIEHAKPKIHDLKCWPKDFDAIVRGDKTHEARRNDDRKFAVGDTLRLHEWIPDDPNACHWLGAACHASNPGETCRTTGKYTGRTVDRIVTHVTLNQYGLPAGLAVMSLRAPADPDPVIKALHPHSLTIDALSSEIVRGRTKFPGHRFMLAALVEEVGELAGGIVAGDRGAIIREAIQVAGLGIRIAEEGDDKQYPPDGFVELVYSLGGVARYAMQRREMDYLSALGMLQSAAHRIAHGDSTFADITDQEAQP